MTERHPNYMDFGNDKRSIMQSTTLSLWSIAEEFCKFNKESPEDNLYEVQYYRESADHPITGHVRRSMLVFAENQDAAREYVKQEVEGFDGFPWDHEAVQVVTEKEYHEA